MINLNFNYADIDSPAMWNIVTGEYWRVDIMQSLSGGKIFNGVMKYQELMRLGLDYNTARHFQSLLDNYCYLVEFDNGRMVIVLQNMSLLPIDIRRNLYSRHLEIMPSTMQFVIPTDCPFIIQGSADANVLTIGKDAQVHHHRVTNFQGWRIEDILDEVVGIGADIMSDTYQKYMQVFNEGMDAEDRAKCQEAFDALCNILHPHNATRKLLRLQMTSLP